jgi:hypothetical protein
MPRLVLVPTRLVLVPTCTQKVETKDNHRQSPVIMISVIILRVDTTPGQEHDHATTARFGLPAAEALLRSCRQTPLFRFAYVPEQRFTEVRCLAGIGMLLAAGAGRTLSLGSTQPPTGRAKPRPALGAQRLWPAAQRSGSF